jgi:hypothetical protein
VSSAGLSHAWEHEVRRCVEQFGAERCMFESNWPVDRVSCMYGVLWNAYKRMIADATRGATTGAVSQHRHAGLRPPGSPYRRYHG